MFGPYPYESFGAAFHPYGFGQGFPTMMMLPPADVEDKHAHAFIAHETGINGGATSSRGGPIAISG